MSASATTTLWKVSIEEGSIYQQRTGSWLFTNERAAKAFAKAASEALDAEHSAYCDISTEEIEAFKTTTAALFQGWPFEELREAATKR